MLAEALPSRRIDHGVALPVCMLLRTFHESNACHQHIMVIIMRGVCVTLGGYDWGRCVAFMMAWMMLVMVWRRVFLMMALNA